MQMCYIKQTIVIIQSVFYGIIEAKTSLLPFSTLFTLLKLRPHTKMIHDSGQMVTWLCNVWRLRQHFHLLSIPKVCACSHGQCLLGNCYAVGVRVFDWSMTSSELSKHHILTTVLSTKVNVHSMTIWDKHKVQHLLEIPPKKTFCSNRLDPEAKLHLCIYLFRSFIYFYFLKLITPSKAGSH